MLSYSGSHCVPGVDSTMHPCMSVLDAAFCLFVLFPLAILHWRGTWGLQDLYIYPEDPHYSALISLIAGMCGCLVLPPVKTLLNRALSGCEHSCVLGCVWRLYLYLSGWFIMAFWRGVWDCMDVWLGTGWLDSVVLYVVCQTISILALSTRNNVGLPYSVSLDCDQTVQKRDDLMLTVQPGVWRYVGNLLYSLLVIVLCNIIVWRCIWNLLDIYLLPSDQLLSDLVSLVLGYILSIQMFLLQVPVGELSHRLESLPWRYKVLFEDIIMVAATWINLLLWRGAWDLTVAYVIPDPVLGPWISHGLATVALLLIQAFNSVGLNALEKDGSFARGAGVFPLSYFSALLVLSKPSSARSSSVGSSIGSSIGELSDDNSDRP